MRRTVPKPFALAGALLILAACHQGTAEINRTAIASITSDTATPQQIQPVSENPVSVPGNLPADRQPAKTIIDFIKWYRNNMDRLNQFPMVNNSFNEPWDSTKFYSVNFEQTEKYLQEFKKSGFVSDKYLDRMRDYFKRCNRQFIDHPQNDGPPDGFEFDLVLWSQEYDEDLAGIDKLTVTPVIIEDREARLKLNYVNGGSLLYTLSQQDGKWLIDHIDNGWTE